MNLLVILVTFAALAFASQVIFNDEDRRAEISRPCKSCYVQGLDIGPGYPYELPWSTLAPKYRFVFIQTTYGRVTIPPYWTMHTSMARNAGLLTGGVHHPNPLDGTAVAQATTFQSNGGTWATNKTSGICRMILTIRDLSSAGLWFPGKTLPGALYLAPNIHASIDACYGQTQAWWISWIRDFTTTYHNLNLPKWPFIFTSVEWWEACTGNYLGYQHMRLWINSTAIDEAAPLPKGWKDWTFWRFKDATQWHVNYFNGDESDLAALSVH